MSSFLFRHATCATAATAGAARALSTTAPRSVARITIVGHLADTPEPQTAGTEENPKEYIRYAVASNSGSKDNRQTSWFLKGTLVYVEGDASIKPYTDASGHTRYGLSIVQRNHIARNIEVLKRPSLPEQGE